MRILRYIGLLLWIPLSAQVSNYGRFSSDYYQGCAPLTVNLTVLDPFGTIDRQYAYEAPLNQNFTTLTSHTYTTPGIYKIVQLTSAPNVEHNTDTLTIEVFQATAPEFNYYYCNNRGVLVEIDDPTYDTYQVEFAGTNQVTIANGQSAMYNFGLAEPLSIKVKGQYDGAPDNCAESTIILPSVKASLSPPTPSTATITQPCEDVYNLNVQAAFEQDVIYEIEWSKSGSAFTSLYEGLLTSNILFEDVGFSNTETSYCVRINARNVCDNGRVIGASVCTALGLNELQPVRNLYSTYVGESVSIVLESTQTGQFVFQRTFDQSNYSTIHRGKESYTDATLFLGRQYFYRVSFDDTCGENWDEQETSPPFIRSSVVSTNKFEINFSPAVHATNENFNYEGRLIGSAGNETFAISSNNFDLSLSPALGEKQEFQIIGTSGTLEVVSNKLTFEFEFIVYVPKAFTPNGDGLNDRLEFFGLDDANAQLNIYNRWGQTIYSEFSSAPSWDGRINGKLAPEGIYIYEITVPEQPNNLQKGTFALIKK